MKHLLRKMLAGMLSAAMIFTGISISAPKTARAEEAVTAAAEEVTTIEAESMDNAGDSVVPEFFEMTNGGWRDLYMGEGKTVGMQFTAPEDGRYAFFTSGDLDTCADMAWNKNMSPIVATNDDISGINSNFRIDTYMSKGSTVYVKMRGYNGAVGSFRAHVCQINEVYFDWNGGEMGPDHMEKLLKYLAYLPAEFPVWGYNIFFDANGGTLPRSDEYKYFEKEFLGWNTSVDGSGTMYQPGDGFSDDSVSTLYAIWKNRPAGMLPIPSRAGYSFQGWYTDNDVRLTETTVLDGETVVRARWTPDPNSTPLIHGEENIDYLEREGELYYCFTAPSAGYYVFWSKSDTDVVGYLYSDSAMNHQLQYDDDSGNNRNFRMRQQLSSGQTVYLKVKGYQQNYGDVDVRVSKELTATYTSGTTVQTETVLYNSVVRATSWVPTKSYTVTFNANGGSTTTSTKTLDVPFRFWVDQDGWYYWTDDYYFPVVDMSFTAAWTDPEAGTLPTPTRSGYTFDGWYTTASGGTKITADSVIDGNMTLYAHWKTDAVTYTIKYNANGGTGAPSAQTKTQGTSLKLRTAVPTREGYEFLGWAESKTASAAQYQPGASFTKDANTTLYAVWGVTAVKLVNGTAKSAVLASGANDIYKFTAASAGEYVFLSKGDIDTYGALYGDGCLTTILARDDNSGTSKNFKITYTMTAGQTVYLKVRGVGTAAGDYSVRACSKYTVTFNANGGSGAPAAQEKLKGSSITLSKTVPTKAGCKFLGWATTKTAVTAEYQPGGTFAVNADTTLYAVWEQASVTITNGSAKTGTIASGKYDTYKFTADAAGTYGFFSVGTVDTYGVLYDDMGLTTILARDDNSGEDKNFKLTYAMTAGQTVYLKVRGVGTAAGDYTVRAGMKYTVKYSANGGTGAPSAQEKFKGYAVTLASSQPTKEGYIFMGWATSKTASVIEYKSGAKFTVNADTTLYAVWGRESIALTNGVAANGTVTSGANTIYRFTAASAGEYSFFTRGSVDTYGALYEDPALSTVKARDDNSGDGKNFRIDYTMAAGQTIYVKVRGVGTAEGSYTIKACRRYAITFDANGGSGAPAAQEKFKGSSVALTKEVPTRSGYTFLGWATSKSATAAEYQPGGSFSVNEDTTLYAVWKKK